MWDLLVPLELPCTTDGQTEKTTLNAVSC